MVIKGLSGFIDSLPPDLCVVAALADPELKALMALPWSWRESDPIDSCTFPYEGTVTVGAASFSAVAATANKAGLTATTVLTSKLLQVYRPRVVALVGICAGVRGKTNIGDVVLGSPAWDWQRGKVVAERGKNKVLIEPIQIPIPSYVDMEYQRLAKDEVAVSKIKTSWQARSPETSLKLRIGPLATGGLVIAAGGGMEVIRGQHRNLTAVDMETYGVYGAAMYGPDPRPTFMSIKGVSDYGEEDKDDQWQAYAAFASAAVLNALIQRSHATLFSMAGRF